MRNRVRDPIHILGGGLAGCEVAYQVARAVPDSPDFSDRKGGGL